MQYTAKALKALFNSPKKLINSTLICSEALTDSRNLINPLKTLFFALKSKRNGADFIQDLYQKGVRNFVVEFDFDGSSFTEANFFEVEDVLRALQMLAAYHRSQFKIPVIGITGSNGKTIVKEWLFHLLKSSHIICKSPKSFNSQIGVALSVLQLKEHHTLAIFEAGISLPEEMKYLETMIKPSIGVFTNLGDAHSEGFGSLEEKAKEKSILFKEAEVVITSATYQTLFQRIFCWSDRDDTEVYVKEQSTEGDFLRFYLKFRAQRYQISIPFTHDTAAQNALLCFTVLAYLELVSDQQLIYFETLPVISNRLEIVKGMYNSVLVNDSYVSDIPSLSYGIQYLNAQAGHKQKWLILSDLEQTALKPKEYINQVNILLKQHKISKFIGIGHYFETHKLLIEVESDFYPNTKAFLNHLDIDDITDKIILIKGARSFQFEEIVSRFSLKAHLTRLEINLQALSNNFSKIKALIPDQTKVMGMVKAFSYGSGIVEVANALQQAGVEYLAVAYSDEGVTLRKNGIHLPIMVMLPETESIEAMIRYNLQPEIHELSQLKYWIHTLSDLKMTSYPVHLKLDTGMHRLGFMPDDMDSVYTLLSNTTTIKLESVFSHFIASDDDNKKALSEQQLSLFQSMTQTLKSVVLYPFLTHIDNSGGIFRKLGKDQSMVRLGIGMYGISAPRDWYLQPVLELKTNISQIKKVKKGETIGYTGKLILSEDKIIAIVRIGYADGYKRAFGNGRAYMVVNGHKAYTIGNICMDVCMIDVSNMDNVKVGDEVMVMGNDPDVETLAEIASTIPYEILTSISERVKRVYQYE